MQGFNWVDYIVLAILFFSTLVGLSRGVVKEVISIATWVAAFFVASVFATPVANYFSSSPQAQSVISSAGSGASAPITWLAYGLSFIGLFIITMIAGAIINSVMSRAVEVSGISFANRLLGALFGMIRGFLLNIMMMFLLQLIPSVMQQTWWTQSVFVNTLQPEVQWLASVAQPGLQTLKSQAGQMLQNINTNVQQGVSSVYRGATQ